MGITVKGLIQYTSECFCNSDYKNMINAFEMVLNMVNRYELREENWVKFIYNIYRQEMHSEN